MVMNLILCPQPITVKERCEMAFLQFLLHFGDCTFKFRSERISAPRHCRLRCLGWWQCCGGAVSFRLAIELLGFSPGHCKFRRDTFDCLASSRGITKRIHRGRTGCEIVGRAIVPLIGQILRAPDVISLGLSVECAGHHHVFASLRIQGNPQPQHCTDDQWRAIDHVDLNDR
jgi:hypothetical protein